MTRSPAHPISRYLARRARREETDVAERWIWFSQSRRVRVTCSRYLLGCGTRGELADKWRVEQFDPPDQKRPWGCWSVASEHRLGSAAFAAAERLIKAEGRVPKAELTTEN